MIINSCGAFKCLTVLAEESRECVSVQQGVSAKEHSCSGNCRG